MATINDFGVPQGGNGLLQPKLSFKWRVTFNGLGGGINSQPVTLNARTVSRPNIQFEEVAQHRYNGVAYVPGKYSFEDLRLMIEDDLNNLATNVIQQQLNRQQQLIGAGAPWLAHTASASDLKFGLVLTQLDGNEQPVEEWHYEGCWLKNVNYGELDYSASDFVRIDMTIRFDIVRQVLLNSGSSGLSLGGPA